MNRDKAIDLLHTYVKNQKMIQHSLASEAVMLQIALHLGQNTETWAMAGLLHDLDVEITNADPKTHGRETVRILTELAEDAEMIAAIGAHNEDSCNRQRETVFEHALAAGETITGLITATALVYPDRKVASVKPKSVIKRMKEKAFAASVKRENILECEKIGIPIEDFVILALNAMTLIHQDLDL
ncbi:MAG TPA: hydrolase [Bacteroidales bacterium]|nr:MAG: hydrolase [Bacteroidetes bacterium GWE2_42_24]OFY29231.1 MAG: hydrolase [Bacteroidetes bacterium GWF2_43_11]PKP27939.1 MAG: hydrolase [Bacteroidetes bacterium HGW-Bacteroidetes-22]HBZ66786.1 hydrolase [Bacteroidales bacterium]